MSGGDSVGYNPWPESLKGLLIEDLLGKRSTGDLKSDMVSRVVFVCKDDTIKEALDLLTQRKIVSAPIYDEEENKFVGFVDVLDLVCYCVNQVGREVNWNIERDELFATPVGSIVDISGRNKWNPLDRKDPLIKLFDTLSLPYMHRVPIIDSSESEPDKKVLAIITQSEMMRWLWESRNSPGFPQEALQLTVKNFIWHDVNVSVLREQYNLCLIRSDKTVLDAFQMINDKRVSGLGVTNEDGELIGNVSASDIKIVSATSQELMSLLNMKLDKFIDLKGNLMLGLDVKASLPHPVTVTEEDTMGNILQTLNENKIHRVWVERPKQAEQIAGTGVGKIEEQRQVPTDKPKLLPVGCVSLCDVINELSNFRRLPVNE